MTTEHPAVAVLSTSSLRVEHETVRSLEEMIFEASTEALTRAGFTIADIDAVVVSANDEVDGRVISIMAGAGPAGGVGLDTTMVNSSGDHALIYGWQRILAGQSRHVLVAGWSKPSEGLNPDHAELVEAEPYILRNVGMNHTLASALQAGALGHRPSGEVVAWPLGAGDLPQRGDAVFALVLAADGSFPAGSELAWLLDCGWTTVTYELGARDLSRFEALELALAQLAKRGAPAPSTWDAVEIAAGSEAAVAGAAASLGLAGSATVNASGALAERITAPHVQGLGRMVDVVEAIGAGGPKVAAGIGFHGFAGQGAAVAVFGAEKGK